MELIFLALLVFIAVWISFRVVRKTVSIFFSVTVIVGILLLVLGFFLIQDTVDFKKNLGEEESIFVLSDGDFVSAIILNFEETDVKPYDEWEDLTKAIEEETSPSGFYKIFIITREALEAADLDALDIGFTVSKSDMIESIFSDDPAMSLAVNMAEEEGVPANVLRQDLLSSFGSSEELKNALLANFLIMVFGSDPLNLIEGVKNGNIIIYPETLMFKTIKFVPFSVFEMAGKGVD